MLVGFLALLYAPLFFGRVLYQRDLSWWILPARAFVRNALAGGYAPTWNPFVGLGLPVLANPLFGLFYPPNLLHLVGPLAWMVTAVLWLHLVFGAVGMLLLARRFVSHPVAALLAGLAWAASGFATSMWTFGIQIAAYAWTPWCGIGFIALLRAFDDPGRSRAGALLRGALPVAAALLLGDPFLAILNVGFGLAVTLVWRYGQPADHPAVASFAPGRVVAGALAGVLILAVALAAVSWLPTAWNLSGTERNQALLSSVAEQASLHPLRTLELVAADSMRAAFELQPERVGRMLGGLQPLTTSVYAGGSVLALALLAFGRRRRQAWILAGLAGLAWLLAMGHYTPVHQALRRLVPPLAFMRYPEKYLVLLFGFIALLAAMGAQRFLEQQQRRSIWKRVAGLLVFEALLFPLALWVLPRDLVPAAWRGLAQGLLATLLVGLLTTLRPGWPAVVLLVATIAVDLGLGAFPLLRWSTAQRLAEKPPMAVAILDTAARAPAPPRLYRSPRLSETMRRYLPRDQPVTSVTLHDNFSVIFGIAILPGYDAALSPALGRLLSMGRNQTLRLIGAEFALLPMDDPARNLPARPELEPLLDPVPGARLYRVPNVLPRVYLAPEAVVADDNQALREVAEPPVLDGRRVILAPGSGAQARVPTPATRGNCSLEAFAPANIEATCEGESAGFAVFLEQHASGWTATVDGMPAPVLRANLVMRAVPVTAGRHRIALRYWPDGLAAGLGVSAAGLAACLVFLLAPRLRGRRRGSPLAGT
ncbi:MAG: YfhO family protein [Polyangia bacterium]|jgi:hypothetical protein